MFVRDWMTRSVVTAAPDTRLFAVLKTMNNRKIRRIAVVSDKRLIGIITKSDVYAALGPAQQWGAYEEGQEPTVDEVMTPNPVTVSASDPIEAAALTMHDNRISGLPVMEGGRLVGVITETDVFKAFLDITGVKEGGGRISFRVSSAKALLPEVEHRTNGLLLRSLLSCRDKDGWHVVVRVRGRARKA